MRLAEGGGGPHLSSTLLPPSLDPQTSHFVPNTITPLLEFPPLSGPHSLLFHMGLSEKQISLRGEILIKYFCLKRSLLETQYLDSDKRKMVGNFRHCERFLRADQAAPRSTPPPLSSVPRTLRYTDPAGRGPESPPS